MGFFSNYYNKPGPGIPKNLPVKKGFKLFVEIFIREFWELIKLNMLYLLFCIPIVTIPAATTAMSRITLLMVRDQNHFLWTDFWKAFKADFVRSLLAGLILFVGFVASAFGIRFYSGMTATSQFFLVPMGISCILLLMVTVMGFYIYPMIALVTLPFKQLFKNALILFVVCLPFNLLIVAVVGVLGFAYLMFLPLTLPLWIVLSFSLFNFISTFIAHRGMKKYIIRPEDGGEGGHPAKAAEEPVQLPEKAQTQGE